MRLPDGTDLINVAHEGLQFKTQLQAGNDTVEGGTFVFDRVPMRYYDGSWFLEDEDLEETEDEYLADDDSDVGF